MESNESQRLRVLCELVDTEVTYVNGLKDFIEKYIHAISFAEEVEVQDLLIDSHVSSLFSSLRSIFILNSNFLQRLQKRLEKSMTTGNMPRIGDIVSHFAPLFNIYNEFAKEHQQALSSLSSELKKPFFEKYAVNYTNFNEMNFNGALISPIQRVPRYQLLLAEISKLLSADGKKADAEEKSKIDESITAFKVAASIMNEAIAFKENRDKLQAIMRSMQGSSPINILQPGRKFIKEGVLFKLNADFGPSSLNSKQKYMFFLYNDYLIYCSEVPKGFRFHKALFVSEMEYIMALPKFGDIEFPFVIITKDKTLVAGCGSNYEREQWLDCFKKAYKVAIDNLSANADNKLIESKKKSSSVAEAISPSKNMTSIIEVRKKANSTIENAVKEDKSGNSSVTVAEIEKEIKGVARLATTNRIFLFKNHYLNVNTFHMQTIYLFNDMLIVGTTICLDSCNLKATIMLHSLVIDVIKNDNSTYIFSVYNDKKKDEVFNLYSTTLDLYERLPNKNGKTNTIVDEINTIEVVGIAVKDTNRESVSMVASRSPSSSSVTPPLLSPSSSSLNSAIPPSTKLSFRSVMSQLLSLGRNKEAIPSRDTIPSISSTVSNRDSRNASGGSMPISIAIAESNIVNDGDGYEMKIGKPKLISVINADKIITTDIPSSRLSTKDAMNSLSNRLNIPPTSPSSANISTSPIKAPVRPPRPPTSAFSSQAISGMTGSQTTDSSSRSNSTTDAPITSTISPPRSPSTSTPPRPPKNRAESTTKEPPPLPTSPPRSPSTSKETPPPRSPARSDSPTLKDGTTSPVLPPRSSARSDSPVMKEAPPLPAKRKDSKAEK